MKTMPELESIHDMPPAPLPEPAALTHECLECMALLTEAQVYQVGGLLKHISLERLGQLRDMRAVRQGVDRGADRKRLVKHYYRDRGLPNAPARVFGDRVLGYVRGSVRAVSAAINHGGTEGWG